MTLDTVESILWSQARHLNATDPIVRDTTMQAIREAIRAYAEDQAGPIVAARRKVLACDGSDLFEEVAS